MHQEGKAIFRQREKTSLLGSENFENARYNRVIPVASMGEISGRCLPPPYRSSALVTPTSYLPHTGYRPPPNPA